MVDQIGPPRLRNPTQRLEPQGGLGPGAKAGWGQGLAENDNGQLEKLAIEHGSKRMA